MKKNDLFPLEIIDMGTEGQGIGKYQGMTFFVKDACVGDVIKARALKLKKNYGYARVEEVITPSTFRVLPKCSVAKTCGGCQLQNLTYAAQLEFKNNKVRQNLIRLGGFEPEEIQKKMLPIIGMEDPFRYRNKAQFPVGLDKENRVVTGFYAIRSHRIIPVEDCLLGREENGQILDVIKNWMQQYRITSYDEESGKGLLRHILIRYGFTSKQWMVCLIINGRKLPQGEELCKELAKIRGMTSVSYNINQENTNVILGKETVTIWGQSYITDDIHLLHCPDYKTYSEAEAGQRQAIDVTSYCKDFQPEGSKVSYRISPQSFYQVNPKQTEKLYSTALEFASLTGEESVWDLYCGIGTISLFLAQRAKQVYGVEIVPQAIEDAKENAKLNGITNAEFFVGKAEEVLPAFYEQCKDKQGTDSEETNISMAHPDVIVVDPPRKGCDRKCLDTMLAMQPDRIVYVSCDSATLARDLRILCDGGYQLVKVQACDQFAQTVHVESIVLLSRV